MFDINKPHKRRDNGDYEIVAIKDGVAFGFYYNDSKKIPSYWEVSDNCLAFGVNKPDSFDIIQLPEEHEVVGYQNVYCTELGGNTVDSVEKAKTVKKNGCLGIIKTTAKIIDGKLVSVKSEIVE